MIEIEQIANSSGRNWPPWSDKGKITILNAVSAVFYFNLFII